MSSWLLNRLHARAHPIQFRGERLKKSVDVMQIEGAAVTMHEAPARGFDLESLALQHDLRRHTASKISSHSSSDWLPR